jgi:hypothetical protein
VRVFLVDGVSGRVLKRVSASNAEDLVSLGIAERRSDRVIALKATGHRNSFLPRFDELRLDTAHWVDCKRRGPNLTKEKQKFLRFMKGLAG